MMASGNGTACFNFKTYPLTNSSFVIDAGWQAIPETLVFNVIFFVFFLAIFAILRRLAWDRKNLNSKRTSKGWLQSIYGDRKFANNVLTRDNSQIIHHNHDLQINLLIPPASLSNEVPSQQSAPDTTNVLRNSPTIITTTDSGDQNGQTDPHEPTRVQSEENVSEYNVFTSLPNNIQATFAGVGYRLRDVLLISDDQILKSRGSDALQYLIFQQYVIYFLTMLSVFSMIVVLPVNLLGTEFGADQGFARTTVINLHENSPLHWVHVVGATLISLIGYLLMNRFSKAIKMDEDEISRRTLLVRRVPKRKRINKELLTAYFRRTVPNCVVEGVQPVYNVRKLTALIDEMTNLVNANCYCVEYFEITNERLRIRPRHCGRIGVVCGCCYCCRTVDGIEYYSSQETKLRQQILRELNSTLASPTGQFFITFQTEKMAQESFVHLRRQQEKIYSFCPFANTFTQVSSWIVRLFRTPNNDELEVSRWMCSYAPYPNDINWCDISVNLRMQWLRSILVNILLFILFVFISTPAVILNASETIKLANLFEWLQYFLPADLTSKKPEIFAPFILMIAASALPAIVTLACQSIAYINISAKNHAIMWKVFLFLTLMVIIWPSFGLTSLKAFLLTLVNEGDFRWECLFPVKLGAFFVNYTVQYAFIGNIMELMRIPELLVYLWYMATARSQAEVSSASRYVVWDFAIGIRYPRFLLIFAMVVTYSLSCPLITVAGLLYMIIKHFIDRYNIYYVYNPSKINSKIHSTAIIFVHVGLLMMQAQIFTVTLVRTGYSWMFGFALIGFLVSCLVFSGHLFFYLFSNINHLTYRATRKQPESRREFCCCSYIPPALHNLTAQSEGSHSSSPTVRTHLRTPSNSTFKAGYSSVDVYYDRCANGSDSGLSDDIGIEIKISSPNDESLE